MTSITYAQATILGLVQGLSEFLPISSSGHLAILQKIFGVSGDNVLIFPILLHFGTLVAVFIVYRCDIWALIKELGAVFVDLVSGRGLMIRKNEIRKLGFLIIIASIPTAIIGLCFQGIFESFYSSLISIGIGLFFTSAILYFADRMGGGEKIASTMMFRNAVFIGIMQGIAISPGVSRSGSTLFGGLITKLDRAFAVKFAFLISIPSILGSLILELPDALSKGSLNAQWGPVLIGMAVSAVSGFFAIKVMIKIVTANKLSWFAVYTSIIGITAVICGIFI